MTTLAYRDGILASDSDSGRGDYRCAGTVPKIFRTRDGICGVTGSIAHGMALVRWLQAESPIVDAPATSSEVSLVHIRKDGAVEVHEDGGVHSPQFEFMAWGSGMAAALGALYAGSSAEEAVAIASKVDPHTGGPVVTLRLSAV